MFDWHKLENPVRSVIGQSIKDCCCARLDDVFFVFYSVFYEEHGRLRCAVCEVSTTDFLDYSEPILWLGPDVEVKGYASPDISQVGDTFYLTLNSWGDKEGSPNQLWFATSTDLTRWTRLKPLARNLTQGERSIDAALYYQPDGWRLVWKNQSHTTVMAQASDPEGDFAPVGDGAIAFHQADGSSTHGGHENYQLLTLEGRPHLLATCFAAGHLPVLYRLGQCPQSDADWLDWYQVSTLRPPVETFNTRDVANASALYDWRAMDGFFYLLYAGTTESDTFRGDSRWGRGWNQLALARSRDLIHWIPAGMDA